MQEYEQIKNLEMQTIELVSKIRDLEAELQAEKQKNEALKEEIRGYQEEIYEISEDLRESFKQTSRYAQELISELDIRDKDDKKRDALISSLQSRLTECEEAKAGGFVKKFLWLFGIKIHPMFGG